MRGVRSIAVLSSFLVLALVLAACGNGVDDTTTEPEQPAEQPGEDPVDAPDAAGEIILGAPTALGTVEGRASVQAAQLAINEINAAGGVDVGGETYTFRLVEADTRGAEPDIPIPDALAAIERLIDDHEPHAFVVSPFRSEVLLAAMDLIADEQIPTILSIAMTPEFQTRVTEDAERFKYLYRNGLNAIFLGMYLTGLLGHLADEHGMSSVMLIHQDVAWATGTANGVAGWAEDNGWDVVGMAAIPTGSAEFSSALATAQNAGADVILPLFDMPESGALVPQARGMGIDALIAGFNSPLAAESAADAFDEADLEGVVNLIFEIGPLAVDAVPASGQFIEAFASEYGEAAARSIPGHGPGPAYDSVYILKDAFERAGSLDPDAVADALAETDYEGVIGRTRFGDDHQAIYSMDPAEGALGVAFQWQGGQRVPVFPTTIAEGTITLSP